MRKLKNTYANFIYTIIGVVAICAAMWTDNEWRMIGTISLSSIILIMVLFDKRYFAFFE